MKTYVITLSKAFMRGHQKDGMPTGFEEKIKSGQKIHTIRGNVPFWEKRIREIQEGSAILSIRQWTGKPYRSKQREIARLTSEDGIGIERIILSRSEWAENSEPHFCYWATIEGNEVDIETIARHDGFPDTSDFLMWFDPEINRQNPDEDGWKHLEAAILHFTKFRYQ